MEKQLIFQLGSNNWQCGAEFAPGSGILHEAHHRAYNQMDNTVCYSVYPSSSQTSDDPKVSVYRVPHEVPICESISPVSSYRFHSMTDDEFYGYLDDLERFVEDTIARIEEVESTNVDMVVAHHTFINPWILNNINQRRIACGREGFKILCFVHGTALKMYAHEIAGENAEYPMRFLPLVEELGLFGPNSPIDACAAISNEQLEKFASIFAEYPEERMILSPNGYNASVFKPNGQLYNEREQFAASLQLAESPCSNAPATINTSAKHYVVFCGKFADWKRLDALLAAAKTYEKTHDIATLVIGSGPDEAIEHYHRLAYETLGLSSVYFLGPQQHDVIAQINAISDVGVYPSRNEPFGLVFIEAMGCGTPVIGCNSGGPKDFVSESVGRLVPECEGDELSRCLVDAITEAVDNNWKASKGTYAATLAMQKFSVATQCDNLLESIRTLGSTGEDQEMHPELLRRSILY